MVGLIFDGTILANELMRDSSRSGVFFVAKNLFLELLKRTDVKLALYCNLEQFLYLKRVYIKIIYQISFIAYFK